MLPSGKDTMSNRVKGLHDDDGEIRWEKNTERILNTLVLSYSSKTIPSNYIISGLGGRD